VVHRIDRDTSGLVLFAKSEGAQLALKEQFKRHRPERVYQAVVYGVPSPVSGTWHDHLAWDVKALIQKETSPRDPRGKEAISHYRVLETLKGASLIEVSLVTGKELLVTPEHALHVLEIITAARESSATGKRVSLTSTFKWPVAI
jgi:23S rRNA pseudouridine1911/1915/1917 synthase